MRTQWCLVACMAVVWFAVASQSQVARLDVPPGPADREAGVTEGARALPPLPSPLPPPLRRLKHPGECRFLSFSADGRLLASTNAEGEVRVFEVGSGKEQWAWRFPELLATSIGDLVWPDSPLGTPAWARGLWTYPAAPGWPGGHEARFGPLPDQLAIAHNPSLSHTHVIHIGDEGQLGLNPGFWLFGGYVHLFGGPELEHDRTIETERARHVTPLAGALFGGLPCVLALDFSPTGDRLATGSSDGMLKLWEADTGAYVGSVRAEEGEEGHQAIRALDFSPDGRLIATIGDSGVVRTWSVPSLEQQAELPGHSAPGYWVEIAPGGRHAASAADDGTLRTWDITQCIPLRTMDWGETVAPRPLFAYGRDARWILFGATGKFGVLGIADAARGRVSGVWPIELRPVTAFTVWRGGDLMAAGDRDGKILVWPMATAL